MHLKTLTLKGFKSFASSTTLRLEPGITAVVGPNGSGKSNVVDALTWVMGEQGVKNLRGGSMADVIFAGTSTRPALGRAEVSLTIDNTDGALPIEYSEVTITRTLFRGGGSEYQINGSQVRLLDVAELLSDTGLGRQMHVIVGQGRLDAVLTATPEDRRGFIEEAAGVLKHRRRKERALRKLESMQADLARVTDLTAELRRQLGPLARQAAVARRARTIQAEVRDATARLLADDVVQAQALLDSGSQDGVALARRRAGVEEAERVARARLAELTGADAAGGARLEAATATWQELSSMVQRLEGLAGVAGERVRLLAAVPAATHGTDPDELERRAAQAEAAELELAATVEAARTTLNAATGVRADAESGEQVAENRLTALQRQESERRETLARVGGRVASARSRHESTTAQVAQARAALDAAMARAEEATRAVAAQETRPDRGAETLAEPATDEDGATLTATQAHARAAATAHQQATDALTRAREAVSTATDARREASADLATWTARRDTLALSLRGKDGTAHLLSAGLDGVLGPLAEHLAIERGWENAVAALLGPLVEAALVTDAGAGAAALGRMRDDDAGAVRLVLAQPRAEPTEATHRATEAPDGHTDTVLPEGVVRASLLVTAHGHGADRPGAPAPGQQHRESPGAPSYLAVDHLLRDAWVAPDLTTAVRLRESVPGAVVATRDGELLAPGWMSGAARGSTSVLELAAAHEEAAAEAEEAARAESRADAALTHARASEEEARGAVAEALAGLRRADADAARAAEERARLTSAARAAQEEAGRARRVLERAENEAARATEDLATATAALEAVESAAGQGSEGEGAQEVLQEARQARETAVAAAREARAAETDARLALRTAEERERGGRGRADTLRATARREREQRAAAERAQARRTAQLRVATHVRDQAHRAAEAAATSVERAAAERAAVEEERAGAVRAVSEVRDEIDRLVQELAHLTDAAHREEIARAEQRMRLERLAERAMDELGLGLETLVEEFGPHMAVPALDQDDGEPGDGEADAQAGEAVGPGETERRGGGAAGPRVAGRPYVRSEQEKRLARASRDLTRLGKVNPLALEEHAALEQRHQFLAEQLADLKRSRADLLHIVDEVDARVQEVFAQAYEDTARQFTQVFGRLFPGGEGRLVLTDPQDMLTTGIEIEARPAGKRVKRLSLLSGGERSLAAVALLVAIFKARPSPFYVMDEVEAALDDTNLGRLLEIFTELRQSSQLIIITHQKRTMEVADALYGITMREGVTQAVSQRLERRTGS